MRQESGRSMIEMLGVLTIMGLITVGSITLYRLVMNSYKRNTVSEDVVKIVNEVRTLFRGRDDFSGIDNSTIFGAIDISNRNPYGGVYTVSLDPSNPRQVVVGITGLSKSECEYWKIKAWPDSIGYQISDGKQSGATGDCSNTNGQNSVYITYGD